MHALGQRFESAILEATDASSLEVLAVIQELWSGYGKILRVRIDREGHSSSTVIVKHVRLPGGTSRHPRGWDTGVSHARKLRSYQVETEWYHVWSQLCDSHCRIPRCLATDMDGDEVLILMEDLDAAGFSRRLVSVDWEQIEACLHWLAHFHATFLQVDPVGLWHTGTYWHLATRPDELQVLADSRLKQAAPEIDRRLRNARFQTLVHGDAKLANFCFSSDARDVAAVDFQYVGGGCGIKDVAYFAGSCLNEEDCEQKEDDLLDCYFAELRHAMVQRKKSEDTDEVIAEWREMYPFAWTDFHRFLKGWSPDHWKINSYSEGVAREVMTKIETTMAADSAD